MTKRVGSFEISKEQKRRRKSCIKFSYISNNNHEITKTEEPEYHKTSQTSQLPTTKPMDVDDVEESNKFMTHLFWRITPEEYIDGIENAMQ